MSQEPGGWQWDLTRPDHDQVYVTIRFSADVMTGPMPPQPGEPRFAARLALADLVDAVAAGARRCLNELGAEHYAEQWLEHPFPALQLEALERWALTSGTAARYEFE